jgi:serine/threonine protein kinase
VHRVRRSRFATECRLWVQLGEHPNIVQAYSVEVFEGRPYVVLELIRGGDLYRWMRSPKLDLIQTLRFGVQFCLGLEHALRQGLSCHRDVKPANLLIAADGSLKLTDFGLANVSEEMVAVRPIPTDGGAIPLSDIPSNQMIRFSDPRDQRPTAEPPRQASHPRPQSETRSGPDSEIGIALDTDRDSSATRPKKSGKGQRLTQDGVRIGTAVYMAPEQFRDPSSVDVRADIYSFGVVLFEMIAGHAPFKADSVEKLEYLHMNSKPPTLAASIPPKLKKLAPEVEAIVARCLKKEPGDRFGKVSDLRKALIRALSMAGARP